MAPRDEDRLVPPVWLMVQRLTIWTVNPVPLGSSCAIYMDRIYHSYVDHTDIECVAYCIALIVGEKNKQTWIKCSESPDVQIKTKSKYCVASEETGHRMWWYCHDSCPGGCPWADACARQWENNGLPEVHRGSLEEQHRRMCEAPRGAAAAVLYLLPSSLVD